MTKAVFNRNLLNHYKVIESPGTYIVTVANTVLPKHLIEDSNPRYIVNLRANTESNLIRCVDTLGLREECYWDEINKNFIPGVIWENDIEDLINLPTKGEKVIATYDIGDTGVMRCNSITLIPRKSLKSFNPNSYSTTNKLIQDLMFNHKI